MSALRVGRNAICSISWIYKCTFKLSAGFGAQILPNHPLQRGTRDVQKFCQLPFVQFSAGVALIQQGGIIGHSDLLPTLVHSVPLSNGDAFPLAVEQVLAFKFVDGGDHSQHQLAGGCSGVQILFVADQMHALSLQALHNFQQVFGASCKATEVVDIDCITLTHIVQHRLQLGSVHALAADLFCELLFDAVGAECLNLARLVLFFGADADVCDLHNITSLADMKNRVRDARND